MLSTIRGYSISDNPVIHRKQTVVDFNGTYNGEKDSFGVTLDDLSKHTLLVGSTGCGKTTLLYQYVGQIMESMSQNDIMIIFDSKGDYFKRFYDKRKDIVIGNSKEYIDISEHWSIFREMIEGESPKTWDFIRQNTHEICKALFQDKIKKSNNQFFPNAASELFEAILLTMLKNAINDHGRRLNNSVLRSFLQNNDVNALREFLTLEDEFSSVLSYVGEGADSQSLGVISELNLAVNELLTGVFCKDDINKLFSIRRFVSRKEKRVLFLEYDLGMGNTLTPIYRLMIDLALKEAMTTDSQSGNVYLILDEFRLLPNLNHIDDAVNFGRSRGLKVIAGLQSLEQLYDAYGKSHGNAILAGFSNTYFYKANDWTTRQYVKDLLGKNVCMDSYRDLSGEYKTHIREGNVGEDWELSILDIGQAIVFLPFEKPFLFHFDKKAGKI